MKVNYRKSLKFVTLLITALLIASVSAQLYDYLYMKATPIKVIGAKVYYTLGDNTGEAGGTINTAGTEVVFTSMNSSAGSIRTYNEAVNITNGDTAAHNIELKFDSWSGDYSSIQWINITVLNETGDTMGNVIRLYSGTTETTTGVISIPATTPAAVWTVKWEILWQESASVGTEMNLIMLLVVET